MEPRETLTLSTEWGLAGPSSLPPSPLSLLHLLLRCCPAPAQSTRSRSLSDVGCATGGTGRTPRPWQYSPLPLDPSVTAHDRHLVEHLRRPPSPEEGRRRLRLLRVNVAGGWGGALSAPPPPSARPPALLRSRTLRPVERPSSSSSESTPNAASLLPSVCSSLVNPPPAVPSTIVHPPPSASVTLRLLRHWAPLHNIRTSLPFLRPSFVRLIVTFGTCF